MRAVPGVDQDLVVGVSLPLHLLGPMGTARGLRLTGGGEGRGVEPSVR